MAAFLAVQIILFVLILAVLHGARAGAPDRQGKDAAIVLWAYAAASILRKNAGFSWPADFSVKIIDTALTDMLAWYRWLHCRRINRAFVFQTGAGLSLSSGRFHHVDHRRDYPAIYLDKIGGLSKAFALLTCVRNERETTPPIPRWSFPFYVRSLTAAVRPKFNCGCGLLFSSCLR